jgi:hypothetical protein
MDESVVFPRTHPREKLRRKHQEFFRGFKVEENDPHADKEPVS